MSHTVYIRFGMYRYIGLNYIKYEYYNKFVIPPK